MQLKRNNEILISELLVARTMWSRMKGLLGTQSLSEKSALWIHQCNSIHTFFMSYAIDCVFLDKELKICSLKKDIKPGRLVLPQLRAKSVIEMKSGQIDKLNLQTGEQLYVGA